MIEFNYETEFRLEDESSIVKWVSDAIKLEGFKVGDINYVFCDDQYLHKINLEFLNHDTLTDIISFDYSIGKIIQGDIFISIERVMENAEEFGQPFEKELRRVIIHGVLHYCGYRDKSENESLEMRAKEDFYLDRIVSN